MNARIKKSLAVVGVAAMAAIGAQVIGAGAASAHDNSVVGSSACQSADGTYTVTWTISNDYNLTEVSTITGHAPSAGVLSATSVSIGKNGTGTITESKIPGSSTSASLSTSNKWSDGYPNTDSGSLSLAGACNTSLPIPAAPMPTVPTCATPGAATIPANTDSVHWTLAGNTATAKAQSGYQFSDGKSVETFIEVVLPQLSGDQCATVVTPVAPKITEPSCTGPGTSSNGTDALPENGNGITYSQTGNVVTAVSDSSHKFGTLPTGWVLVDAHHATFAVSYTSAGTCFISVPVAVSPVVTPPTCSTNGSLVIPANTASVKWTVNGNKVNDGLGYTEGPGAYALVAHTTFGYEFPGQTGQSSVEFDLNVLATGTGLDCNTVVIPLVPVLSAPVCDTTTGIITLGSPVLPTAPKGITYTAKGDVVTATLSTGYEFGKALDSNWVKAENGLSATYTLTPIVTGTCTKTVVVTSPPAPPTTPVTPKTVVAAPQPPLAFTGFDSTTFGLAGAIVLFLGAALTFLARRRTRGNHSA